MNSMSGQSRVAEKFKVATEKLEVPRQSVTEFMTVKESAEEMIRQSEEQRKELKLRDNRRNRLNEQISQLMNVMPKNPHSRLSNAVEATHGQK